MKNGVFIDVYKNKHYYVNSKLHREDGPAFEGNNGAKWWYQNGLIHRLDGPAIIYSNDSKEWYYQNQQIDCQSQEEFEKLIKLKAFW